MHELGLALHMLDIVKDAAEKNHVRAVKGIKVKVGAYSGVVPELITECFGPASMGTVAEGAVLTYVSVPVTVSCASCGKTGEVKEHDFTCPFCGSDQIRLVTGREFYIDSIEAEDP